MGKKNTTTATLTLITGADRGRRIELSEKRGEMVIGRKDSDIVLRDAAVSREHARIRAWGGRFELLDCGSANGTFLNDRRIDEVAVLMHNDQIRCGSTVLLFEREGEPFARRGVKNEKEVQTAAETMVGLTVGELISKTSAKQRQRAAQAGLKAFNISHGIKNLLQTIQSGREVVDCALEINDVERAKRGWRILDDNLDQINKLVLDLLRFSKERELQVSPALLNRLVESVVDGARALGEKKNIAMSLETDDDVGEVEVDGDKIGEALLNLILNAVEAVVEGEGRIDITTELDRAKGQVVISVVDNGAGIEDTEAIFEPFFSTAKKAHTGLGLPIARKIIEQHGGSIGVKSRPGEGSEFTIRLPLA